MTNVFIGSTSRDLVAYRQAAIDTCLKLDLFPVAMEHFEAMGMGATAGSKLKVEKGDLYVGIFAYRYGYIEKGYDKGVTEIEFDYAGERDLERICFVVDPKHPWPHDADDDNLDYPQKFRDFKGRINTLIRAEFTDVNDFTAKLMHALVMWKERHPAESAPVPISTASVSAYLASDSDDLTEKPRKLIGRESLVSEVTQLLKQGEQVLLQGFGGMGKTALAATVASDWIKAGKGAALWLKAGSASADALFEALARPFKLQQEIVAAAGDEKTRLMRQILRESGIKLLVLDDCWNGGALFILLKAVPDELPVLSTARQRFALEKIRDVGELAPPDALTVLGHYADYNYSADLQSTALCKHLGYHAFALEIAGKNLKARKLQPAELLTEIQNTSHEMKMPLELSDPNRRHIKDLLDASLNALPEDAKNIFLAFGAFFEPSLTSEMLELYLDNLNIPDTLALLQSHGLTEKTIATDRSQSIPLRTSYRIHDLSYSYALAQAKPEQRQRALETCLSYLSRHNRPSIENFAALLPELDNLLNAADYAFQNERFVEMEEFAWDLYANSELLSRLGYPGEAIHLLEKAAQAAKKRGDQRAEGAHLGNLGSAYSNRGQVEIAIDCHEQALAISREIKDRRSESNNLGNLGNAHFYLGQFETTIDYYQQALAIAREIQDRKDEGRWMGGLGVVYTVQHKFQIAIEHYQQALNISREIKDRISEGNHLGNLGNAYRALGQVETAIEYYQQALTIAREIKDRRGEGNSLGNLGNAYSDLGQVETAIEYTQQALTIAREIKDRSGEGSDLGNLGNAYRDLGQIETAIEYYQQALTIAREIHDRRGEGNHLGNLGNAYRDLGQVETAIEYTQQALTISREIKDRRGEGNHLSNLGNVYVALGQVETAIEYYQQALAISREIKDRRGEGSRLGNLGNAYRDLGQVETAIDYYQQARAIFVETSAPHLVAQTDRNIEAIRG